MTKMKFEEKPVEIKIRRSQFHILLKIYFEMEWSKGLTEFEYDEFKSIIENIADEYNGTLSGAIKFFLEKTK